MIQTPVVDLLDENDLTLSKGKPEKDKKNICYEPQGVCSDVL